MSEKKQDVLDQLPELFKNTLTSLGVPGGIVGILYDGEIKTFPFGITNADHPLPVTQDTLFQIGSISKTYTATAIMRLVEMEKIDLDENVRHYLPEFQVSDETASAKVTVRQLLCHTAGWAGDYFLDTGRGDDALELFVKAMAEIEQVSPIDFAFSYNNTAFQLAGRIIEVVTGKTYEDAVQALVFKPMGLDDSYFDPTQVMVHRYVVGHTATPKGPVVAEPWPLSRNANPAGGIICTAHDLLKYGRFHMGEGKAEDGTQLLSKNSMAVMRTTHSTIWQDETIGLSWFLKPYNDVLSLSHGGTTIGQQAELLLVPERGFAVAVLTNADKGLTAIDMVKSWVLKELLGLDSPKLEAQEAGEDALAEYTGRYTSTSATMELGLLCGRLVVQMVSNRGYPNADDPPPPPPPPFSLGLCNKDRLIGLNGPLEDHPAEVLRDSDGNVAYLRFGLRLYKRID
jgi:CubicO group peptidase (beta-lactamase class C family)